MRTELVHKGINGNVYAVIRRKLTEKAALLFEDRQHFVREPAHLDGLADRIDGREERLCDIRADTTDRPAALGFFLREKSPVLDRGAGGLLVLVRGAGDPRVDHGPGAVADVFRGAHIRGDRIDERRLTRDILRSEERRVGKECRSRWSPYH